MRIKEFIIFSKKERNIIYVLSLILVLIYAYNSFIIPKQKLKQNTISLNEILIKNEIPEAEIKNIIKQSTEISQKKKTERKYNKQKVVLSEFDPNTSDSLHLISLGLHRFTVSNIIRYRSKGGQFRKCEDLYRIYNIDSMKVSSLLSYCNIKQPFPEKQSYTKSDYKKPKNNTKTVTKKSTYPKYKKEIVDINTADTTALKTLYGIGPYLSKAIVERREELGGFHSLDQLNDIFLFEPEIIENNKDYMICSEKIIKININEADLQRLRNHIYINYKLAKLIVNYRSQHGLYAKVEDIKNIVIVNDSIYNKINPYLRVK